MPDAVELERRSSVLRPVVAPSSAHMAIDHETRHLVFSGKWHYLPYVRYLRYARGRPKNKNQMSNFPRTLRYNYALIPGEPDGEIDEAQRYHLRVIR